MHSDGVSNMGSRQTLEELEVQVAPRGHCCISESGEHCINLTEDVHDDPVGGISTAYVCRNDSIP